MSHEDHPYSASGAIFLDNPLRRLIQPPKELIEKLGITPSHIVVDFGCRPGYFTVDLAKKAKNVVAIDVSLEMLKKAQNKTKKAHIKNVKFLQSNGKTIELSDGSVDLILLVTVFHEIGDSQAVLKEFSRILKPNGRVAIVEVIKKGTFAFAPMQNPEALTAQVEADGFKLQEMKPYKAYGVFLFNKT